MGTVPILLVILAQLVPAEAGSENPNVLKSSMSFPWKRESRLVPAEAGNQKYGRLLSRYLWIPACAGTSTEETCLGRNDR